MSYKFYSIFVATAACLGCELRHGLGEGAANRALTECEEQLVTNGVDLAEASRTCDCDGGPGYIDPERPHAGAQDPGHTYVGDDWQANSPEIVHGLPIIPANSQCNVVVYEIDGLTTVTPGCPTNRATWEEYSREELARRYDAELTVSGGANTVFVLWEKTADAVAQENGSAPYRWCDENGNNRLSDRRDFWCNMRQDPSPQGILLAPMCSAGGYTICATPVFNCDCGSGTPTGTYQGRRVCINVTARP
jgi:hypothetical protein